LRRLAPVSVVLFDTTCYDVDAPEIMRVVERCLYEGVLCVLVRSHIKIDTLGLEYGRLGSIVFVLPRPCDPASAGLAQRLRRRASDFLIKVGAGFSPHTFFPLHSDVEFRRLNGERNAIMRDNNLRGAATLCQEIHERSTMRFRSYHHGRFLFLQPAVDDWSAAFARSLRRALDETGAYVRIAPSFAYDFVGITRLTGQQYQTGGGLRVSFPDYPREIIDRCLEAMIRFAIETAPTKLRA
jgi:hypothetical protein